MTNTTATENKAYTPAELKAAVELITRASANHGFQVKDLAEAEQQQGFPGAARRELLIPGQVLRARFVKTPELETSLEAAGFDAGMFQTVPFLENYFRPPLDFELLPGVAEHIAGRGMDVVMMVSQHIPGTLTRSTLTIPKQLPRSNEPVLPCRVCRVTVAIYNWEALRVWLLKNHLAPSHHEWN